MSRRLERLLSRSDLRTLLDYTSLLSTWASLIGFFFKLIFLRPKVVGFLTSFIFLVAITNGFLTTGAEVEAKVFAPFCLIPPLINNACILALRFVFLSGTSVEFFFATSLIAVFFATGAALALTAIIDFF